MACIESTSAGLLARLFVTSRLTVLFMLACAVLGLLAILATPREENPQIVVPSAQVRVALPGASPEEVEEQVLRPLEGIVQQIPGVDHTFGTALNSMALLTVQFRVGEDKEVSLVKLYDRVLGQRERLPADAGAPVVQSIDVDDVPILTVTLSAERYDDHALKRLADRLMEGLRSLDATASVSVVGGRDRELRIEVDPLRLDAFRVSLDEVQAAVRTANVSATVGSVVQQGQQRQVFIDGFLGSAQALEDLVVATHRPRAIRLRDVARVVDGPADERSRLSRFARGPADPRFDRQRPGEAAAVTLAVAKKRGSNAVTVARTALARIEQMRAQFIPADVQLTVTRNDGEKANAAVNNLIEHLGIAVAVVLVIVTLFLGLKEAGIIGITIPLVVGVTLGVVYLCGYTINRVTLFALILSLGLLVDDAIVVIENIHRHYGQLRGRSTHQAAVEACSEIGNATSLATLAVMLVFGSMFVIGGMMGQYIRPIAFTVPVAMGCSLLVAYIVVPWAANRWMQPKATAHAQAEADPDAHAAPDRLQRAYRRGMDGVVSHRRRCIGVFIAVSLAVVLSGLQAGWQFIRPAGPGGPQSAFGVELAMMAKNNQNTFNITIEMPPATPVETTDRLVREIGALLREQPLVLDYQSWVGQAGVPDFTSLMRGTGDRMAEHLAEIRVNLIDKHRRSTSSIDLVRTLRPAVQRLAARYPGCTVQLVEDPPGPPMRAIVLAELYGHDLPALRALAVQVKAAFAQTHDMAEVSSSEAEPQPQVRLVIDHEKAALSGVNAMQAGAALRRVLAGETLGRAHLAGERNPVPIRLQVPRAQTPDPRWLGGVWLTNAHGQKVPLSELVQPRMASADRPILHKDNERAILVGGELGHSASPYAVLDLDRRLDGLALPGGQRLRTGNLSFHRMAPDTTTGPLLLWDGELRLALDTYRDMLVALVLALGFVFLVLVVYYQSFLLPLVAMSAIPLGLAGVFPGHWLLGQAFSATSMVGIISLAGVVVRNSLLIIDFALDRMRRGQPVRQAVLDAGVVRLRPILLTALAVVLGSAVMLSDPVFGGLAISLIFGTLASTVLGMVVVPVLLYRVLRHTAPVAPSPEPGPA